MTKAKLFAAVAVSTVFFSLLARDPAEPATPLDPVPSPLLSPAPSVPSSLAPISPRPPTLSSADRLTVIEHVTKARAALKKRKFKDARAELNRARAQVNEYRTSNFITVYSNLAYAEGFSQTERATQHLQRATEDLRNGNIRAAQEEVKKSGTSVIYTEIKVPVDQTRRNLNSALRSLDESRPGKADRSLKLIEDGLHITIAQLNPIAPSPTASPGVPLARTSPNILESPRAIAPRQPGPSPPIAGG
ncbi:MAG TPA: YfdX family protein [Bdellovibrionota bacterium]|nr:YfdX family protein [Bdellovibrionota bacterium]